MRTYAAAAIRLPARSFFTDAAEPGCGRCHTLADAEAEGTIGPNLDFLRPGYQQVLDAVRLLLFAIVNVAVDPCR